jgi:hypothetical protein
MSRPKSEVKSSTYSIRVEERMWAKAKERAASEGVTITQVLREFLNGYALEKLDMPRIVRDYDIVHREADPE